MAEHEELNFLLLIGIFLKFARDYVSKPFNDLPEIGTCSCGHDLSTSFWPQNSLPRCTKHIHKVLLTLVKIKQSLLDDTEFAKLSRRITNAIVLANEPKDRESLVKELEAFCINRTLDRHDKEALEEYEKWKNKARERELFIEDDKKRLQLSEELKKSLGHSLQKCKGVTAYSLGGEFFNFEICFNPEKVTEDDILYFITNQLEMHADCDLWKRPYFSDLLTFIPSTEIRIFEQEFFPGMNVYQTDQRFWQTCGVFFKIKGEGQKLITMVTHGRDFDKNTGFITHTRGLAGHTPFGPYWGHVYTQPSANLPAADSANTQPEEGFVDLCCAEVSEDRFLKMNKRWEKGLVVERMEPSCVNQLNGRKVQKYGAATGLTHGTIKYPNSTFQVILDGAIVWMNDVIVTESEIMDGSGNDIAQTGNGDSGATITTRPTEMDQAVVDAISVHIGSYKAFNTRNQQVSYSVSFPFGPAIRKLETQKDVELEFVKTFIPT